MKYQYSLMNSGPWYDEGTGPFDKKTHEENVTNCGFKIEWREKPEEEIKKEDWKDGIHKEGMETYFYTKTRRFVLRMTDDGGGVHPVWVFESMRPNRCCVCGTTENLHKDFDRYRCDSNKCVAF